MCGAHHPVVLPAVAVERLPIPVLARQLAPALRADGPAAKELVRPHQAGPRRLRRRCGHEGGIAVDGFGAAVRVCISKLSAMPKQMTQKARRPMNPSAKLPVQLLTSPITTGGKNPPSPPIAPTIPVAAPGFSGNSPGTSLKITPLPMPRKTPIDRHAIDTVNIVGCVAIAARTAPSTATPAKAAVRTI